MATTAPVIPQQMIWYMSYKDEGQAYSQFINHTGRIITVPFEGEYDRLIDTPNYPQPKKEENISLLAAMTTEAAATYGSVDSRSVDADSVAFAFSTAGDDRLLVAASAVDDGTPNATMTYNGSGLSTAQTRNTGFSDPSRMELEYLVAPDTGSNTFSISGFSGNDFCVVVAYYTGMDQTSPLDNANNSVDSSSPYVTGSLSLTNAGIMVMMGSDDDDTASARTVSGTGNERKDILCGSGAGDYGAWFSDRIETSSGSYTLGYSNGTASYSEMVYATFKEAAAAASGAAPVESFWDDEF